MKGVFISSLLLLHFYLDASLEKNQKPPTKKQKRSFSPTELTDINYKKIAQDKLIIILIKADWCQYSKNITPLFLENCSQFSPHVSFFIVDLGTDFINKSPILKLLEKNIVHRSVDQIPTLLILKNGKLLEDVIAKQDKTQIAELIKVHGKQT